MSACPSCGASLKQDARFCHRCGATSGYCRTCGASLEPADRFCAGCGKPVRSTAVQPPDERRVATILFADVSGFTALSEALDPEEVKAIMDRCFRRLSTEIERHGGAVDKFIGDCVMALFGVPLSRGDDAAHAVRAALAMQVELRAFAAELEAERGFKLAMRIGINTGNVLAGVVGTRGERDYTVMGDAVNTASRLEHHAPVGGILISAETAAGIGDGFELLAQAPLEVKGKKQPLEVFLVAAEKASSRFQGTVLRHRDQDLVGREVEFVALRSAFLESIRAQEPRLAKVIGPAGIGKSRLVAAFLEDLKDYREPVRTVQIRAPDFLSSQPYPTWGPLFAKLLLPDQADGAGMDPAALRAVAAGFVRRENEEGMEPEWPSDAADLVAFLCGIPLERESSAAVQARSARDFSRCCHRAAGDVLAGLLGGKPLVLVLSGLHHASDGDLELLEHLVRNLEGLPLMIVGQARPELETARPRFLEDSGRVLTLRLEPLNKAQALRLAWKLFPEPRPEPTAIEPLVERAGGNPLFIGELVRWMVEGKGALPASLQGVLAARLDRLPEPVRTAVRAASICGPSFWPDAVRSLLDDPPWNADQLRIADVAQHSAAPALPGVEEWTFRVPLLRDAAYESVARHDRARMHRVVADWLAGLEVSPDRVAPILSHHLDQAGDKRRAADLSLSVSKRAMDDRHTRVALRLAREALSQGGDDWQGREEALLLAARAALGTGEARAALEFLGPLLEREEPDVAVLDLAARAHDACGDAALARELSERALARAEDRDRAGLWATLGWSQLLSGRVAAALDAAEQGLRLATAPGQPEALAALWNLKGAVACQLNDLDGATKSFKEALRVAVEVKDKRASAHALSNLAAVEHRQGRLEQASIYAREALDLERRIGDGEGAAGSLINLANTELLLGRFDRTLDLLSKAYRATVRLGLPRLQGLALYTAAQTAWRLGSVRSAASKLPLARKLLEDSGDRTNLASLELLAGTVALDREDLDEAAARLGSALEGYVQTGDFRGHAEAEVRLLELGLCRGDPAELALVRAEALDKNLSGRIEDELNVELALFRGLAANLAGDRRHAVLALRRGLALARRPGACGPVARMSRLWLSLAKARGTAASHKLQGVVRRASRRAIERKLARIEDPALKKTCLQNCSIN